jgi:3-isopropylmalate/(R)-2-methylmalate dehydratase large subunit
MITWGTSPQQAVAIDGVVPEQSASGTGPEAYARALQYMDLAPGTAHHVVTDRRGVHPALAPIAESPICVARPHCLRGRSVAPGVRAICAPGSMSVKRQAEAEGLDKIFVEAGFEWRESAGCSMCFFAGGESSAHAGRVVYPPGINFESRQGPRRARASPETVAASAVAGHIADARALEPR